MSPSQTTVDNAHSSQPAAQHPGKRDEIVNKAGYGYYNCSYLNLGPVR